MKIFIDANKYLDLLRVYKDANRSEIIKFLIEKQKKEVFKVVVTDQVLDEFYRNEYLLRQIQVVVPALNLQPPYFLQNIPEVKKVAKMKDKLEKLAKKIQEKYIERLTNRNSAINKKVEAIVSKAFNITASSDIFEKAYFRILRGNPPGKARGCIGDAISWETLLAFCSDDDLVIVTRDSDFFDRGTKQIEDNHINTFLEREWKMKSGKSIRICHSFSSLMDLFPDKAISKKEIKSIKKDEVGLTKGLTYSIQTPTGPTGPIDLVNLSGYPSSVLSASIDNPLASGFINKDRYIESLNRISLPETYKIPDYLSPIGMSASSLMREDIKCSLCGKKLGTLPFGSYMALTDVFCSDCSTVI